MKEIEKLILEKKYSEFKKEILNFDAADIAEILSELNDELLIKFFRLLPKDIAAETFSFLELDSQQIIINSLTAKEAAGIIDRMVADDATPFNAIFTQSKGDCSLRNAITIPALVWSS